jgi:hypothetical protein
MGEDLHIMAIVTATIYYRMAPIKRLDAEASKSLLFTVIQFLFSPNILGSNNNFTQQTNWKALSSTEKYKPRLELDNYFGGKLCLFRDVTVEIQCMYPFCTHRKFAVRT